MMSHVPIVCSFLFVLILHCMNIKQFIHLSIPSILLSVGIYLGCSQFGLCVSLFGLCNKDTERLKQQTFISSPSGGWTRKLKAPAALLSPEASLLGSLTATFSMSSCGLSSVHAPPNTHRSSQQVKRREKLGRQEVAFVRAESTAEPLGAMHPSRGQHTNIGASPLSWNELNVQEVNEPTLHQMPASRNLLVS